MRDISGAEHVALRRFVLDVQQQPLIGDLAGGADHFDLDAGIARGESAAKQFGGFGVGLTGIPGERGPPRGRFAFQRRRVGVRAARQRRRGGQRAGTDAPAAWRTSMTGVLRDVAVVSCLACQGGGRECRSAGGRPQTGFIQSSVATMPPSTQVNSNFGIGETASFLDAAAIGDARRG